MKGLKENKQDAKGKLKLWKLAQNHPRKLSLEELAQASSLK